MAAGASYKMIKGEGDYHLYVPLFLVGSAAAGYSFFTRQQSTGIQIPSSPKIAEPWNWGRKAGHQQEVTPFDLEGILSEVRKTPAKEQGDIVHGTNGSYLLQEQLSEGGPFGIVYRGQEINSGLDVAVKINDKYLDHLKGYLRAVEAVTNIAKYNHEGAKNILPVIEAIQQELALVTPYSHIGTLGMRIRRRVRLSPAKTAVIASDLCDALAATHAAGVLHRDVKPANILLRRNREKEEALLFDYDASLCERTEQLEQVGYAPGTTVYQAPEAHDDNVELKPTLDIYSAGISIYEMLTGDIPFNGDEIVILTHHQLTPLPKHPAIPKPFMPVLEKACAKDPEDRHQSAAELKEDVLQVARKL